MKLYLLTNGLGTYYVLANSPNQAQELLEKSLDIADYGFKSKRGVTNIKLLAIEIEEFPKGKPCFSKDENLILIAS